MIPLTTQLFFIFTVTGAWLIIFTVFLRRIESKEATED